MFHITTGVMLMTMWLGAAGEQFFALASCGWLEHIPRLHTPMSSSKLARHGDNRSSGSGSSSSSNSSIDSNSDSNRNRNRRRRPNGRVGRVGVAVTQALHDTEHTLLSVERALHKRCIDGMRRALRRLLACQIVRSWAALGVSLLCAAAVLYHLEHEHAATQARDWWSNYNTIIADFHASELQAGAADGSLSGDIQKALDLLNAMGTCGFVCVRSCFVLCSFVAFFVFFCVCLL
jgi:hypothetical protein